MRQAPGRQVLGRSSRVVVESSRNGALQEAKPQIGMYDFIAVGTSF